MIMLLNDTKLIKWFKENSIKLEKRKGKKGFKKNRENWGKLHKSRNLFLIFRENEEQINNFYKKLFKLFGENIKTVSLKGKKHTYIY